MGICIGQYFAIERQSAHIELLATEKQDIIISENRMLRSRSNFALPEMGATELRAITTVALALNWPWELIQTGEKTENGGMRLELGIQQIPKDIKLNFPPNLWQRAAATRIMQEEAGNMILNDPEVTVIFVSRLAKRWKALDSKAWRNNFILHLRTNLLIFEIIYIPGNKEFIPIGGLLPDPIENEGKNWMFGGAEDD